MTLARTLVTILVVAALLTAVTFALYNLGGEAPPERGKGGEIQNR